MGNPSLLGKAVKESIFTMFPKPIKRVTLGRFGAEVYARANELYYAYLLDAIETSAVSYDIAFISLDGLDKSAIRN